MATQTVVHPSGLDVARLPRLAKDEVRLLWVSDYYDGLLTGVAEYQGRRHLLVIAEFDRMGTPDEARRWVLYALTDEQLRIEERWHMLFRQLVPNGLGDFSGEPVPPLEGPAGPETFYAQYQREYRPPVLVLSQAVGWCDGYSAHHRVAVDRSGVAGSGSG